MERKLIAFDFDGTLVDAQTGFDQALIEFGTTRSIPYDTKKLAMGYVDPSRYDLGFGVPLAEQEAILEEYHQFLLENNGRFIPDFFDDMRVTLEALQDFCDFGIVTMRDRASLLLTLEKHGFGDFFKSYRSSCCVRERNYKLKPAPDALECLMEEMGFTPENTVVVGDTTADVDMANGAGTKSIAVLWGAHPRERLAGSNPTLIIDSRLELRDAVRKVFS